MRHVGHEIPSHFHEHGHFRDVVEHGHGHEQLAFAHDGADEHLKLAAGHIVHFKLHGLFRHGVLERLYALLQIGRRNDLHGLQPLGVGRAGEEPHQRGVHAAYAAFVIHHEHAFRNAVEHGVELRLLGKNVIDLHFHALGHGIHRRSQRREFVARQRAQADGVRCGFRAWPDFPRRKS